MNRYMYKLSYKLGIPKHKLARQMTVEQVAEYIAYDLTLNEDFAKRITEQKEIEASEQLSAQEFANTLVQALSGKK